MHNILVSVCLLLVLALTGCNSASTTSEKKPDEKPSGDAAKQPELLAGGYDADVMAKRIAESMSELSAEDRKLAEQQKFCPVGVEFDESGQPVSGFLGSIGKPVKVMVGDRAVFIMCPNCTEKFQSDTDKYLDVLEKVKASQAATN